MWGAANQECQIQLQIVKHIVLVSRYFVENFLVFIIFRFVSMRDRTAERRAVIVRVRETSSTLWEFIENASIYV